MSVSGTSFWGWYGLCFRAMNTQVEVQLYARADGTGAQYPASLPGSVQRMFDKAEACMSRFDPASELSRLNRSAGCARVVSPLLFDVVEAAVWAASTTGGLFDPTLLKAMEAIGYDRSFEQIPKQAPAAGLSGKTWQVSENLPGLWGAPETDGSGPLPPDAHRGQTRSVGLNRSRREIYLPPGVQLDLGGIGKGWTVDRAADWLAGVGPFLINAGGDLYAYGAPPGQPGWSIGIVDPWRPGQDIARLQVRQREVATSTISRRRWQHGGRPVHHLIDPRSGRPAETDAVSVSVVAQRVALAEVYAKAALILGAEAGLGLLNSLPEVEGLLIRADGRLLTSDGLGAYLQDGPDARQ